MRCATFCQHHVFPLEGVLLYGIMKGQAGAEARTDLGKDRMISPQCWLLCWNFQIFRHFGRNASCQQVALALILSSKVIRRQHSINSKILIYSQSKSSTLNNLTFSQFFSLSDICWKLSEHDEEIITFSPFYSEPSFRFLALLNLL